MQRLEKLEAPATHRLYIRDSRCRNLWLAVTSKGAKSFFIYRRINGRPTRYTLGRFPDLSVEQARKNADQVCGQIVCGIDPRAARRELKHGITLQELFDDYLETHAKARKRTWRDDEKQFSRYILPWKNRPLSEIKRHHVATLHARVGEQHGQYAANRMIALLQSMFSFAERDRGYTGGNPAKGVRRFQEEKRARFLQPAEMPAFMQAVEAEPSELVRDFVKLALFTGARKSNISGMRWADIDFVNGIWTIPHTKSGRSVPLPLCPEAIEILKRRQACADISEFVLPSYGKSGHLEEPKIAWRKLLERAGIVDLRIHDLRRTFGSWQAGAGSSLPIIGKALGHASTAATAIYSRLHLEPVRQSINQAVAAMTAAATKKMSSHV